MKSLLKKLTILFFILSLSLSFVPSPCFEITKAQTSPMLAIVIDDFGGYEQGGVETMLSINAPLTCAIMPNLENTFINTQQALESNKEIIVHMPMQASVNLPEMWYGTNYIKINDTTEQINKKLDLAFSSVKNAKGFNIHIGSGVCQHYQPIKDIYNYAIKNNLFFLDSRTHTNTVCQTVAKDLNVIYLGRDEFLEPKGFKSYEGAKHHLMVAANLAKEKGYAIAIGHVGNHGGESTAQAIKDCLKDIESLGVKIVPLSEIYQNLSSKYVSKKTQNNISKN